MDLNQFDIFLKPSDDVVLTYTGIINQEVVDHIIGMTEQSFLLIKETKKVRKKVINLLIESVQNIYHYFDSEVNKNLQVSSVMVIKTDSSYKIFTQNYLKTKKAQILKKRIDNINQLSKVDLDALYIEVLKSSSNLIGGSNASLGLIDMVRRSTQKIEYDFNSYDKEHNIFTMQLNILHN